MQRQGGGSIVSIGSVLGLKAALAFPVHPYAVAKAGVAMLTKTIAVLHLASDEAAWTTGAILTVDGGIMAQ